MKGINKCIKLLLIIIFIYFIIKSLKKKNIEGIDETDEILDDPEQQLLEENYRFSHDGSPL